MKAASSAGIPGTEVRTTPLTRPASNPRLLPTGWPLTALFLGFPLWWMLGVATFAFVLFAVPMAIELLTRRGLRAPRGFGMWLLFLVWIVASAAMLWVDAPGAEPGGGGAGRIIVYGYRAAMYLSATIALLYVLNMPERDLPTRRVVRLLGFMFVVTTCGGLLGVVAPGFTFSSPMELLLPEGIASNEFVMSMIHPAAADVQSILGYEEARPIAPFSFANSWGANFALYLPFFVLAWLGRGAGWRRWVAPFVLLAGLVPAVYSLNRGLWLALGFGACYLAARLAAMGKFWALNLIGATVVIGGLAFALSPLGTMVQQRMDAPHSNDRRADLAVATVQAVVEGSPVLGFGSTRDVKGSFFSIAGGSTPDCPACGVPPLGTQGQLWLVVFSQGIVGLALFLAFFARRYLAHHRDRSPLAIAGCCVLAFFGIELFVYDTFDAPMVTVMITLGLLARGVPSAAQDPDQAGGSP
ncbi:MAG: O-antigen ligase family protein [Actinopolymorphaceae bacterium]